MGFGFLWKRPLARWSLACCFSSSEWIFLDSSESSCALFRKLIIQGGWGAEEEKEKKEEG